jgi:hypothetical protein
MSVVSKPAGSDLVVYSKDFTGSPNGFAFNTRAGACSKSSIELETSAPSPYDYREWAVTHVGVYEINFRATGTVGGVAKDSGNVKYTFFVQ